MERVLPPTGDIRIRPARVGDAAGIARVQVECWRDAYVGILPDKLLINLNDVRAASRLVQQIGALDDSSLFVVALWRRSVVGFCQGGGQRRGAFPLVEAHDTGEIFTLYVDPNFQGLGIGTALLTISTLTGNHGARRFYETLGGSAGEDLTSVVMGSPTTETPYYWGDMSALLTRLDAAIG
jgi:GNAT superfamily N-acetyltransferase